MVAPRQPAILQGAIIAAGRGERLRSATQSLPKPLVRISGEPLIAWQANALLRAGADEVFAVINSETAHLLSSESVGLPGRLRLTTADTANSMESLFKLGEMLRPGWFVAATVDAIVSADELKRMVESASELSASPGFDGMLGVVRWRGDARPLFVEVALAKSHAAGAITKIGVPQSQFVTAGIYFLHTRVFDYVDKARNKSLSALREFLSLLVESGTALQAFEFKQAIDVDEPDDLGAAAEMLASSPTRSARS